LVPGGSAIGSPQNAVRWSHCCASIGIRTGDTVETVPGDRTVQPEPSGGTIWALVVLALRGALRVAVDVTVFPAKSVAVVGLRNFVHARRVERPKNKIPEAVDKPKFLPRKKRGK
jgi:hypothetical protein